jgi:hypothetical protein
MQGDLSIEQMCRLADVSRSDFYRSYEVKMPVEDEVRLRALVQEIALEHRLRYGYRRVAAEVRRRGIVANHKRIARIMRVDNLLNMRPLRDVGSRNPGERFEIYLNLAARMPGFAFRRRQNHASTWHRMAAGCPYPRRSRTGRQYPRGKTCRLHAPQCRQRSYKAALATSRGHYIVLQVPSRFTIVLGPEKSACVDRSGHFWAARPKIAKSHRNG